MQFMSKNWDQQFTNTNAMMHDECCYKFLSNDNELPFDNKIYTAHLPYQKSTISCVFLQKHRQTILLRPQREESFSYLFNAEERNCIRIQYVSTGHCIGCSVFANKFVLVLNLKNGCDDQQDSRMLVPHPILAQDSPVPTPASKWGSIEPSCCSS